MKPLKRRYEVRKGFVEKHKSGKDDLKRSSDHGEGAKLWRAKPRSVGDWKKSPRTWVA